jgi:transcriptional regulator with XRE-family HTH domain
MLQSLVAARKASRVTQAELAERLGLHQSFVSKFESGDRRIDVVEFLLICRALEANPVEILSAVRSSIENS